MLIRQSGVRNRNPNEGLKMSHVTRRKLIGTAAGGALLAQPSKPATRPASPRIFDVRQFGAVGDGAALDTGAIQKAIDACAASGGAVVIANGRYVTGTLFLKSNVTLSIEAGALLLGSSQIGDYARGTHRNMYAREPHMDRCLIFARDAENVGLEGKGTIDGRGGSFPNQGDSGRNRPMLLRFLNCRNVFLRDITLQNPASWTSAFLYSDDIRVDGINISSRARGNGDGLDFDGCQNVRVSNCRLDNSDDSICLQSSESSKPVRNVVITNCIMTSRWAAIRIGLLSRGNFEDVTVSNCVFHDIEGEALKIQMAEGGRMENLLFSNIVMKNVPRPVFLTFNSFPFRVDSPGEPPPMQSLRNVMFSNMRIEADNSCPDSRNSFIAVLGLPDHPIEGVTFDNISFTAPGGGTRADAARREIPELAGIRPERQPLGPALPSYGVYARHVRNLSLINMRLEAREKDLRPALVCDDVEGLRLANVSIQGDPEAGSLMLLRNTKDALIQGSGPVGRSAAFLSVEGRDTRGVGLLGNDLRGCARALDRADEVAPDAVVEGPNLGPSAPGVPAP
jgi:hypothetical protein